MATHLGHATEASFFAQRRARAVDVLSMKPTHLVAPERRYEGDGVEWIELRCPCGRLHRSGAETMLVTCDCGDRILVDPTPNAGNATVAGRSRGRHCGDDTIGVAGCPVNVSSRWPAGE